MATKKTKKKPRMHLSFPKAGGVQPEGFADLKVGQDVTVTIRGTVRELSDDPNREWSPGKDVALEMAGCAFAADGGGSLADALEKGQRRV